MFEMDDDDCEDAVCDPHQDWPTQDMLASESPVCKTLVKTYTGSIRGRGKRGQREISEEDAIARSKYNISSIPYDSPDWLFGKA